MKDITVELPNERKIIFPCNNWLAKDEADNKLERDLFPLEQIRDKSNRQHLFIGSKQKTSLILKFITKKLNNYKTLDEQDYHIYVKTSDIINAGTDANVTINLHFSDLSFI